VALPEPFLRAPATAEDLLHHALCIRFRVHGVLLAEPHALQPKLLNRLVERVLWQRCVLAPDDAGAHAAGHDSEHVDTGSHQPLPSTQRNPSDILERLQLYAETVGIGVQRGLASVIRAAKDERDDGSNGADIDDGALGLNQQRYECLHHAHHAENVDVKNALDSGVNFQVRARPRRPLSRIVDEDIELPAGERGKLLFRRRN
jgi:hypothetical protein